jgi:UDP-glucose 4-epimerase
MTAAQPVLVWIIGRGGLLGSHLDASLAAHLLGSRVWDCGVPHFSWHSAILRDQLDAAGDAFAAEVTRAGLPWAVLWVAGAGVIGTAEEVLRAETAAWEVVLNAVSRHVLHGRRVQPGFVFLASSAGGVYGGCADAVITENSEPQPMSAYGFNKQRQEAAFAEWAKAHHGVTCRIGRISNLYGAGQNLDKRQGIISQISRCLIWQQPIHLYVPLDTIRDYLHADDCARQIFRDIDMWRSRSGASEAANCGVKLFVSGRPTTIAEIVGAFAALSTKRHPRVICSPSALGLQQPRRLLFRSVVAPSCDHLPSIPLQVGIHQVHQHQMQLHQRGRLPPP